MNELRPSNFANLIGQDKLVNSLNISVLSANKRNDSLNHCLFSGPAGLGKTTLSNALVEEFLYPVMEDFKIDMSDGEEVISVQIPKFTLVGATTEAGVLSAPLRDRFKLKFTLELYDELSLATLIESNSKKLKIEMSDDAVFSLAKASRGTPRIANGLLEWVRDYRIAKGLKVITQSDLVASLSMRGIHTDGSTEQDRKYLNFLKTQKNPVGLDTIVSSINVNKDTVLNVIEPFLLQSGKILKTSKGRMSND